MVWRKIFRYTDALLERKFPDAFIHLRNAYYFNEVNDRVRAELHRIETAGFDNVVLMHANALKLNDSVILLSGPRGIGKTSLSRNLEKRGVQLLEDGIVLTAEKKGEPYFLFTGLQEFRKSYNAYKGKMRTPLYSRTFSSGGPKSRPVRWLDMQIPKLSAVLAAFKAPLTNSAKPEGLPISKIILFNDHLHKFRPKRINLTTGKLDEVFLSEFNRTHFIRTDRPRNIRLTDIVHLLK
jgi:hypothetical protein